MQPDVYGQSVYVHVRVDKSLYGGAGGLYMYVCIGGICVAVGF